MCMYFFKNKKKIPIRTLYQCTEDFPFKCLSHVYVLGVITESGQVHKYHYKFKKGHQFVAKSLKKVFSQRQSVVTYIPPQAPTLSSMPKVLLPIFFFFFFFNRGNDFFGSILIRYYGCQLNWLMWQLFFMKLKSSQSWELSSSVREAHGDPNSIQRNLMTSFPNKEMKRRVEVSQWDCTAGFGALGGQKFEILNLRLACET